MKRKTFKSMLCMMVFAIVSLHSVLLHGHQDSCPERHLHAFAHCDQLDIFIPADTGTDEPTLLFCIKTEPSASMDPTVCLCLSDRIPDRSDPFVASERPDTGGSGLRAPPAV